MRCDGVVTWMAAGLLLVGRGYGKKAATEHADRGDPDHTCDVS